MVDRTYTENTTEEASLHRQASLGHAPLRHFLHGLCLETRQKSMSLDVGRHHRRVLVLVLRWLLRIFHQNGNLCATCLMAEVIRKIPNVLPQHLCGFGAMVLFPTVWELFYDLDCWSHRWRSMLRPIAIALYLADA